MNEIFGLHENWSDCDISSSRRKNKRWCMSSHGYSGSVRASSISSSLQKQQRDRSDGLSLEVETIGSVEVDIM